MKTWHWIIIAIAVIIIIGMILSYMSLKTIAKSENESYLAAKAEYDLCKKISPEKNCWAIMEKLN